MGGQFTLALHAPGGLITDALLFGVGRQFHAQDIPQQLVIRPVFDYT